MAIILVHRALAALSTQAAADGNGLSIPPVLLIIVGAVISIFYIREMYLILHYAWESGAINIDFEPELEVRHDASSANKTLLYDSAMLVVLSALIAPPMAGAGLFLYIGPV